ncbi:MAG: thiamine pyrophosphate-dependent dehydrogenase E1 component subunit alpha [Lachnospiraceae bacterium]|nr:thiamine pyrophosphate-dependent dehydrogenase E1 component subunit alpha [Lachnospiraceae bacterium]
MDINRLKSLFELICESRYFQETLSAADFGGYMDTGEEAITAGVLFALKDDDYINNYFRGDGMALRYRGAISLEDEMAWWFGKQSPNRPVTSLVPTNYTSFEKKIIGATSSCLGGDADLYMGIAMAQKMKKTGNVVAFVTGDGTLGKGNYHETFTMASLFKLPIIFVIRSNGWAMSTPVEGSVAFRHVSDLAHAYQIMDDVVDGNDALAVMEAVEKACEYARSGKGPVIIEAKTYRMSPHSSHDEDDYRPACIRTHWRAKDPVTVMGRILAEFGVSQEEITSIEEATKTRVAKAFDACSNYPAFDVNLVLEKEIATVNHMWGKE